MGIVYHVKFIHDYCFEAGNSIITNSGVYQSVCLVIVSINDDLAEGRRQAFSMVQTAISKSAHVALILLPPKKPTTRIEPSSARLLHMLFGPSRSSDWSGHLRSPWTTLRSQRTFSCTRATYGSTITALASLWKSSRLSSRTVPLLVNYEQGRWTWQLRLYCRQPKIYHPRLGHCRPDSSLRRASPDRADSSFAMDRWILFRGLQSWQQAREAGRILCWTATILGPWTDPAWQRPAFSAYTRKTSCRGQGQSW